MLLYLWNLHIILNRNLMEHIVERTNLLQSNVSLKSKRLKLYYLDFKSLVIENNKAEEIFIACSVSRLLEWHHMHVVLSNAVVSGVIPAHEGAMLWIFPYLVYSRSYPLKSSLECLLCNEKKNSCQSRK